MMTHLEERNQKIIDAIIEKANVVYPGTLAMIGVDGSFMTGGDSCEIRFGFAHSG